MNGVSSDHQRLTVLLCVLLQSLEIRTQRIEKCDIVCRREMSGEDEGDKNHGLEHACRIRQ